MLYAVSKSRCSFGRWRRVCAGAFFCCAAGLVAAQGPQAPAVVAAAVPSAAGPVTGELSAGSQGTPEATAAAAKAAPPRFALPGASPAPAVTATPAGASRTGALLSMADVREPASGERAALPFRLSPQERRQLRDQVRSVWQSPGPSVRKTGGPAY